MRIRDIPLRAWGGVLTVAVRIAVGIYEWWSGRRKNKPRYSKQARSKRA